MGEIFEYFKDQTYQDISNQLNNYGVQAEALLSQIDIKESILSKSQLFNNVNNIYNELNKTERNSRHWIQGSELLQATENYLIQKRNQMQLNYLYLQGYKLLNQIGHYINQTSWDYTVVLFGEHSVTLSLQLDEFLKFTHFTAEGMVLDTKDSILNRLGEIQNGTITEWEKTDNPYSSEYNLTAYKNYQYTIDRAKAILVQGKADSGRFSFNQGERLEGFLAYMEDEQKRFLRIAKLQAIKEIAFKQSSRHLGLSVFNHLHTMIQEVLDALRSQTNQRGFWSGGDIKKYGQVKGENATVFKFSTIRNQLDRVSQLLINIDFSPLQEGLSRAGPKAAQILKQKANNKINELINVFNSTNIQAIGTDFNLTNSEIDQIIETEFSN